MPVRELRPDEMVLPLDGAPSRGVRELRADEAVIPFHPSSSESTTQTSAEGISGAATRGLAPIAAGAVAGGIIGGPAGAGVGAGAMALTEVTAGLYDAIASRFGWPTVATPREMTDRLLDLAGVKRPSTGVERTVEAATGAAAGAGGAAKLAEVVSRNVASPVARGVSEQLAARPGLQVASGVSGGAAGQLAAEAGAGPVGQTVASMVGGALPFKPSQLASAITKQNTAQIDNFIERNYHRSIKPTVAGKSTISQLDKYNQQMASGIKSIIDNKANLRLTDAFGERVGPLPKTILEFGQAIGQTKQKIFQEYDAMTRQAGATPAQVPLVPVVSELEKVAGDRVLQVLHPEVADSAASVAERFKTQGAFSPEEAQRAIEILNTDLEAYYKNPTYDTASRAAVSAMVANKLRSGLDHVIESAVAPGYQELKNQYGALRAIENDVLHRAVVEGRKTTGGGVIGNFYDIVSAEELVRGVITLNPHAVATGAGIKSVGLITRYLRDPNRAVKRLFEAADKKQQAAPEEMPPIQLGGVLGLTNISPAANVSQTLGLH